MCLSTTTVRNRRLNHNMENAARFSAVACERLSLMDFALRFSQLALRMAFDDETLKSLFWIRANYYLPVDIPDHIQTYQIVWIISGSDHHSQAKSPACHPCDQQRLSPPADSKLPPVATSEPMPEDWKTAPIIAPEPKDHGASDEVCEQAVPSCTEGICVEVEGLVRSLTILDSLVPPSLPLLPPLLNDIVSSSSQPSSQSSATSTALSELSPTSPTVSPLPPLSDVVTPRAYYEPPSPGHGDPVAPPPASDRIII